MPQLRAAVALALLPCAAAVSDGGAPAPAPSSEPPTPRIAANLATTNVFWPMEVAADGTVFACTYLPTLVLANRTRLIAHGRCYTEAQAKACGGYHVDVAARGALRRDVRGTAPPLGPINLCQKHSDDGGRSWSRIRSIATGVTTGQLLWDRVGQVLIMQSSTLDDHAMFSHSILERRSTSLGETWGPARNLSAALPGAVTQLVAGLGGALQLSSSNRYHPNRMVWNGVGTVGNRSGALAWYSDDGGRSYQFSRSTNSSAGIFLPDGISEESALAETPSGGIFLSSRNSVYHGPGLCNCRASVRFEKGGDSFGPMFPSPALVEPECEATMLNGDGDDSAAVMFHANPGACTHLRIWHCFTQTLH